MGNNKRHSSLALIMVAFLVLTVVPVASQAIHSTPVPEPETSPRFTLSPVGDFPNGYFDDVEGKPGETIELAVEVANTGEVPTKLRIKAVDALNDINGGFLSGDEAASPTGSTRWIDLPEYVVELDPGTSEVLDFTVKVPGDALPGQYISSIVARTVDTIPMPGMGNFDHTIGYAISIGILVPGDLVQSFELGKPVIERESNYTFLQIPITNNGNYLVRPSGELTLSDSQARTVLTAPVEMGSLYAGLSTIVQISLPEQMPIGEYSVSLHLTDPESGVTASIEEATVTVSVSADSAGVSLVSASVEPNADPIAFANVDITLNNGGQQIPATNVMLNVMHNGELVEEYPLAMNQVLLSGENQYTDRYIPAEMWESGTYTFNIVVSAVDPSGGQETVLLDEELDATIEVP